MGVLNNTPRNAGGDTGRSRAAWATGLCLGLSWLLSGCIQIPSVEQRVQGADQLAREQGWVRQEVDAGLFRLAEYGPAQPPATARLTVYIEGDGLAWISGDMPSDDPTPLDPLALRLALADAAAHGDAVAYLARPCQYVGAATQACDPRYWMGRRFAPEVVEALSLALAQLKARFQAARLRLVGYSGGGAVAALLATRRDDVDELVTVAGNLDTQAWVRWHRIGALDGSLDPADEIAALRHVRQRHFAGGRDAVIPPALLDGFVQRFPPGSDVRLLIEPDFDHRCCWAQGWAARLDAAWARP